MKRSKLALLLLFLVVVLIPGKLVAQDAKTRFEQAYDLAVKGEADKALAEFESLLALAPMDVDLLYNAGTTALKANKLGKSVLYLERALVSDPRCQDCRVNLERANERQQDRVIVRQTEEQSEAASLDGLMNGLRLDLLAWTFVVIHALAAMVWLIRRFSRGERLRFTLVLVLAGLGLFWLASGSLLLLKVHGYEAQRHGVILTPETPVREGPNLNHPSTFSVHEGLKVRLGERVEDWRQVWLQNGLNGYVPERDIEEI